MIAAAPQTTVFKPVAMNKSQLAALYNVSEVTMRKWLSKIPDLGDYIGRSFTPAQIERITNHLGTP